MSTSQECGAASEDASARKIKKYECILLPNTRLLINVLEEEVHLFEYDDYPE